MRLRSKYYYFVAFVCLPDAEEKSRHQRTQGFDYWVTGLGNTKLEVEIPERCHILANSQATSEDLVRPRLSRERNSGIATNATIM